MKYLILLALLIFTTPAKAGVHVGISKIEGFNKSSYFYGYEYEYADKFVIDFSTNILVGSIKKEILYSNGVSYVINSKPTYVGVSFGRRFDTQIGNFVPSATFSFTRVRSRVYYNDINISNDSTHGIVLGGNVNYFPVDNIAISTFVLLGNDEIGLNRSVGIGISYYY